MPVKGSSNGGFYGIMEFLRNEDDSPFYDEDEEIVNSYMGGLWKIKLIRIKLPYFCESFPRKLPYFFEVEICRYFHIVSAVSLLLSSKCCGNYSRAGKSEKSILRAFARTRAKNMYKNFP